VITRASVILAISVLWWVLAACSGTQPPLTVPARANIFGAGHAEPPDPGGGGAGELPPMLPLPPGAKRIVTFPSVTGRVNPIMDYNDWNGPAGDGVGATNVESFGGISGIVHASNGMFLVGVFLSDGMPATPEPSRLDFTNGMPANPLAPHWARLSLSGTGRGTNTTSRPKRHDFTWDLLAATCTRVPLAGTTTTPVSSRSQLTSRWAEVLTSTIRQRGSCQN